MRKIAIIKTGDSCYSRYEDDSLLIDRITDFQEVDDETYKLLTQARADYTLGFTFDIIEVPLDQKQCILDTVDAYKAKIEKVRAEAKAAQEKAEQKKAKDRALNKAKQEAKEKELLAKLAKKHGLPAV